MNLEVCDKQFLASGLNGDKRHLQWLFALSCEVVVGNGWTLEPIC
jgi:hypothetical protein